MLFTADAHPGLADGSITVTFRTWKRAQVKLGGRYRVGPVALEVDAVERVPVDGLTDADARRAGETDRQALLRRLGPVDDPDGLVWRITFHRVASEPDPRAVLAADGDLSDGDVELLVRRLDRMDRSGAVGPWTRSTLGAIAEHPGRVSTELAEALGRDRMAFKADVRKLKALGLTESLPVGYRLTPRGTALLQVLRRSGGDERD